MKTSGKAHGNLWDATVPRPYAQLANLRREEAGGGEATRQAVNAFIKLHCLPLMGCSSGLCAFPVRINSQ